MKTEIVQPAIKSKQAPKTKLERFFTILFLIGICVLCWALLASEWNYAIGCGIALFIISFWLPSDENGVPPGPILH
jgi:hypothetical protein